MPTALVTGGSAGIGLAFARRLAAEGYDLVLVARNTERLEKAAAELTAAPGADVMTISADLTDRAALQVVADRLADPDRPVDLLVNNAGHGVHRSFLGSEAREQEEMLDVHCRAALVLTHAAGRAMAARGGGQIINVSSIAGFRNLGTYSSVKAWVTSFSLSVAPELHRKGVQVMALCPGFVRTDLVGEALTARLPAAAWVDVDRLVERALADLRRGRTLSIPTLRYRVTAAVLRHLPLRLRFRR
jgi:short-subunit dehydrogenase